MTDDSYTRLPTLQHFADITAPSHYTPLPVNWLVVVTDVEGPAAVVQAGRYRDVTYVGTASIASALDLAGETVVPFVFGGDRATLAVHEPVGQQVHRVDGAGGGYPSAATDLKRRACTLCVAA